MSPLPPLLQDRLRPCFLKTAEKWAAASERSGAPSASCSRKPPWMQGFLAACMYGVLSVLMTLCNKWVVSTWRFEFNSTILLGQMVFSFASLELLRRRGGLDIPPLTRGSLWTFGPLVLLYLGNVAAALTALRLTSVPVYNVLKRIAPLPVMLMDRWLRGQQFSVRVQLSVLAIVLGALVMGSGDLDFDAVGYALALLSCTLQAGYLVYTSKAHDAGFSSPAILYYSALLSIPLLVMTMAHLEGSAVLGYPHWNDRAFQAVLLGCCVMGSLLNYTLFWCCTKNSALTTVVVGQLKGLASSLMGFLLFEKVHVTYIGVAGMALNTGGGALYAGVKYSQAGKKAEDGSVQPRGGKASSFNV